MKLIDNNGKEYAQLNLYIDLIHLLFIKMQREAPYPINPSPQPQVQSNNLTLTQGVGTNTKEHHNMTESHVISIGNNEKNLQNSFPQIYQSKSSTNFEQRRQELIGELQ